MGTKNNNALFFTCSLIEYIGRSIKRTRCEVTDMLGKERVKRIYDYADVFHCELIEKTAAEFIEESQMETGDFDNVRTCRYTVLGYWDIGEVYERLVEDCYNHAYIISGLWEVYHSWIDARILDYNTYFYYQPRDYIAECYKEGKIL